MKLVVLKNNIPIHETSVEILDASEKYEIYVGRSEDCHVQIEDPLISRHHFIIKNEMGDWFCEKLTQLGLVTINGINVQKTKINESDEIKCGPYSVVVHDLKMNGSGVALVGETSRPTIQELPKKIPEASSVSEENKLSLEDLSQASSVGKVDTSPVEDLAIADEQLSDGFSVENENLDEQSLADNFTEEIVEEKNDFDISSTENELGNLDNQVEPEASESTQFFKTFVNYQLKLFGEHAPYDRYQIDADEVFVGRDEKKCQIILNDPEVSSVHAVLRKNAADITIEDLNSSNGTILNGERINKAHLSTGDEFVIGGTSFTLEVRSDLLDAESDRLMPVESGQVIEKEEIEEEVVSGVEANDLNFQNSAPAEKSIIKRILKDPKKKKILYLVGGLVFAYLMFFVDDKPSEDVAPTAVKNAEQEKAKTAPKETKSPLNLSKEQEETRKRSYELGISYFDQGKYYEAEQEFQKVVSIDPSYKQATSYLEQSRASLNIIAEEERIKREEKEKLELKKKIEELMVKAREAVKEHQIQLAESYFSQITEKDPENIEVQQLKLELEAWQKEEERKALEKAARDAARKAMVEALKPGKIFYNKKEWYRAILKLEEFLSKKGMDEDLLKEASEMLSDSRSQLAADLGPLLGKARSLKEGQDLKNAYEAYLDILKIEPTNAEALNEVDDIRNQLDTRSKKIYREGIIAESLSLFTDAKEKFQEVQQISPTDSEYYKKATEKLKDYLE